MLSRGRNARRLPVKPDIEIDAVDQIVRCAIVREADRLGDIGTHLGLATGRNLNVVRIIEIPGQGANGRSSTGFCLCADDGAADIGGCRDIAETKKRQERRFT